MADLGGRGVVRCVDPRWSESTLVVRLRPNGDAHAALQDLFDADSADEYALDCLLAAVMVQFRALQLSYLGNTSLGGRSQRIAAFNRVYGRHLLRVEGRLVAAMPRSLGLQEIGIGERIRLDEPRSFGRLLRPGDFVTIQNPYMPEGHAFRRENATYLGRGRFQGHPLGVFTPDQYAQALIDMGAGYLPHVTGRRAWLLHRSYVDDQVWRAPPASRRPVGVTVTGARQGQ